MSSVTISPSEGVRFGTNRTAPGARSATSGAAGLDNYANNSGKSSENGDFMRIDRWVARGLLWEYSSLPRLRKCGKVTVRSSGHVDVRKTGDAVGFAGLATCSSVHACPVCNSKIQAVRRLEIGVAIAAGAQAGSVAFGAYTLRHRQGQELDHLWRSLSYCFDRVNQDKTVRALRLELGRYGYIRAQETTHGAYGWHPHSHPLVFFDRRITPEKLADLHSEEFRAWRAGATRRNLEAPTMDGQSLRLVTDPSDVLGDYLAKSVFTPSDSLNSSAVGYEMTSTQTKTGRSGSRTPWEILADLQRTGNASDLALWHAWEHGSKGKRALVWSRGLKDRLGITEREDKEIAEEEIGTESDVVLTVTDWAPIVKRPELGAGLLAAVRVGGFAAGAAFCDWEGIPYVRGGE